MQTHPYDILPLDNGAQLIFTPCPGTKETSIDDALTTLKDEKTAMLITLMFDQEMDKNAVNALPVSCKDQGIEWIQLPILDDAAPGVEFESQWAKHKAEIVELINNKGTIAVHCKGGSGRTGLVIGLILLALDWPAKEVIKTVQSIRPKALSHPVQLDYFNTYAI
ncbi:tyrosine-protein phosphatase [Psychromonas sp. KJ10-2]|uniref:phosphatase domain-containing putative toxin n=1 Tax=Psychromonas sp. KJ10-2 TaxID=3391822 RepID=UPI0039B6165C